MRTPDIFLTALRLGCTSFGGPVAHIGFFRAEYVERRRWLDEREFADLVALCQFLPGPASSQVGFAIGMRRGGWAGGLAAWLGFTLPSAVLLTLFAIGLTTNSMLRDPGLLQGMKAAAVAVVALAVWSMARGLCRDLATRAIAVVTAIALAMWPGASMQVAVIGTALALGATCFKPSAAPTEPTGVGVNIRGAGIALLAFFALLIALPILATNAGPGALAYFDGYYRSGSLVFGGGHVVLPLLEDEVVGRAWLSRDTFLAGYGAAQAVPGPLFTFATFLGAAHEQSPNGLGGAALTTFAIFLPSLLLVGGVLPLWTRLRALPRARGALRAANAAVVGLLLAALYDPVVPTGVPSVGAAAVAAGCALGLTTCKLPPWLVVLTAAAIGWLAL